jgi:predicted nuclease of predicted toxin-antitoxin system
MKLSLDENLPNRLKEDFSGHKVYTIRELGWNGKKDAELLSLLEEQHFDSLLTFDKNMRYQQNSSKATVTVIVLSAKLNSYKELTKLSPQVMQLLRKRKLPKLPVQISLD